MSEYVEARLRLVDDCTHMHIQSGELVEAYAHFPHTHQYIIERLHENHMPIKSVVCPDGYYVVIHTDYAVVMTRGVFCNTYITREGEYMERRVPVNKDRRMTYNKDVSDRLPVVQRMIHMRKVLGMTSAQVGIASLREIECGSREPSLQTLRRFCDRMGCTLDYLIDGKGEGEVMDIGPCVTVVVGSASATYESKNTVSTTLKKLIDNLLGESDTL